MTFNIETIEYNHSQYTIWDVSPKSKSFWVRNYKGTNGIIFVFDSTDKERFDEAKQELEELLKDKDHLKKCPVLILANKQDLPSGFSVEEIKAKLGLLDDRNKNEMFKDRKVKVIGCIATASQNHLSEGIEWLDKVLAKQEKKENKKSSS